MDAIFTPVEVRILGCLIEKEATTPDIYPLTLNSLLTACNQKSSREPVMELTTDELVTALDSLIERTLVANWNTGRNRAAKYQHKLRHRVLDEFNFSPPEIAVLCVLFLRGPQTIGEIRSRCARIHDFDNLGEVERVLENLQQRPDGPYTTMLARQEGRKEPRYAHLFYGTADVATVQRNAGSVAADSAGHARVEALELELNEVKAELRDLQQRFDAFTRQFE